MPDTLPGFDLERLDTNVGRGTVLVGNGELMVPGGLSVNLLGHYQRLPLVLSDGESRLEVVRHKATGLLAASYGVLPWLELSAQAPIVLWQQGATPEQFGLAPLASQGLGTPVLQARLGPLSRRRWDPLDLSADLGVGLPLGTLPALAGDLGTRVHARLAVGSSWGWLQSSLEAGVLFRPSIPLATDGRTASTGSTSELRLGAAAATTGQKLRAEVDLRTLFVPGASQVSLDLMGGVRFPLPIGLETFLLGGPSFGNALGTPRFRVLVGVGFRSEPPPEITILDASSGGELEIARQEPETTPGDAGVRPAGTWEFNALTRADTLEVPTERETPRESLRPYQPGPHERVVLRERVFFPHGSADLPDEMPVLDQAALRLQEHPAATVIIEGHSDAEGPGTFNKMMSLRRAQAVRRYLGAQGVPLSRVQIRGFGADWPLGPDAGGETGRRLNSRAEILVLSGENVPAPRS